MTKKEFIQRLVLYRTARLDRPNPDLIAHQTVLIADHLEREFPDFFDAPASDKLDE